MRNRALHIPSPEASIEEQARKEAERLVRQHPPEFLEALIQELQEQVPRRRGRPSGSGEADARLLERMDDLLSSGQASSLREAARQVARRYPGHSEMATQRRLRRKYAQDRDSQTEETSLEIDELAPYFQEDVETWDM